MVGPRGVVLGGSGAHGDKAPLVDAKNYQIPTFAFVQEPPPPCYFDITGGAT